MDFYQTSAWRLLREKVLKLYGERCMNCHTIPSDTGRAPHVDHIKPRSLHPLLELEITNMQVLCENCNCNVKKTKKMDFRTNHHMKLLEKKVGTKVPKTSYRQTPVGPWWKAESRGRTLTKPIELTKKEIEYFKNKSETKYVPIAKTKQSKHSRITGCMLIKKDKG